jgi:hypothetical protein
VLVGSDYGVTDARQCYPEPLASRADLRLMTLALVKPAQDEEPQQNQADCRKRARAIESSGPDVGWVS